MFAKLRARLRVADLSRRGGRVRVRARFELVQRRARRGEGLARVGGFAAREFEAALERRDARRRLAVASRERLVGVPRVAKSVAERRRRRLRLGDARAQRVGPLGRFLSFVAKRRFGRGELRPRLVEREFERARVFVGGSESIVSPRREASLARLERRLGGSRPPVRRARSGSRVDERGLDGREPRAEAAEVRELAAVPGGDVAPPRDDDAERGVPGGGGERRRRRRRGAAGRGEGRERRVFARVSLFRRGRDDAERSFPRRQGAFSPRRRGLARVESAPNLVELAKDESSRDDRGGMISTGIGARAARAGRVRARDRG